MHPAEGGKGSTLVSVRIGRTPVAVLAGDDDAMFLQRDEAPATAPFADDWVSGVYTADEQAVLAGRLPPGATAVEVVAPDGGRVHGTVGSGAWITVVADNHLGIEAYPVLFRGDDGAPVKRHIPPTGLAIRSAGRFHALRAGPRSGISSQRHGKAKARGDRHTGGITATIRGGLTSAASAGTRESSGRATSISDIEPTVRWAGTQQPGSCTGPSGWRAASSPASARSADSGSARTSWIMSVLT